LEGEKEKERFAKKLGKIEKDSKTGSRRRKTKILRKGRTTETNSLLVAEKKSS